MSPSRVPVISRKEPAFRRLSWIPATLGNVSFQAKGSADLCRIQCWVDNEEFDMEAFCRALVFCILLCHSAHRVFTFCGDLCSEPGLRPLI